MAAYVILDVEVTDPALYEEYKKVSGEALRPFGGRFVVRGGAAEILEGDWKPHRLVVLEFPSADRAREWWNSETYREPKALRQSASRGSMVLVEGVPRD
jgi:uncharacterized protein (DUF1330 family)